MDTAPVSQCAVSANGRTGSCDGRHESLKASGPVPGAIGRPSARPPTGRSRRITRACWENEQDAAERNRHRPPPPPLPRAPYPGNALKGRATTFTFAGKTRKYSSTHPAPSPASLGRSWSGDQLEGACPALKISHSFRFSGCSP
ncbi:hypothetical protein SKAU_G00390240 [Synaphobranchus kaupii]|uniref:Uncharacterized protein n=1 Tax=Synaphobranchus kaupii TaxID=118154 RepID=A0A9Q1EBE8_SYNKA|nr:hypothetical protein SKAU_G00390240 [Synaphobranchus kaupii]